MSTLINILYQIAINRADLIKNDLRRDGDIIGRPAYIKITLKDNSPYYQRISIFHYDQDEWSEAKEFLNAINGKFVQFYPRSYAKIKRKEASICTHIDLSYVVNAYRQEVIHNYDILFQYEEPSSYIPYQAHDWIQFNGEQDICSKHSHPNKPDRVKNSELWQVSRKNTRSASEAKKEYYQEIGEIMSSS